MEERLPSGFESRRAAPKEKGVDLTVSLEYIKCSAVANSGKVVGRAFCIALGIDPGSARSGTEAAYGAIVWRDAMRGIRECFENRDSPMDRL